MANFIETTDYAASIHQEILDSLLRKDSSSYDPQIIEICEDRAIAEMRSYMNKTYDCDTIFSARRVVTENEDGSTTVTDNRNSLVLMFALDITIFHIFCQHNPYKLGQMRQARYDRAIEWLKGIMKGDITIDGAPRLDDVTQKENSPWQIESEDIRPILL